MQAIANGVKEFLIPGSLWFLLIGATLGILLMAGPARVRRWGMVCLASLCAAYWTLSLPAVALCLSTGGMQGLQGAEREARIRGLTAIVALGNGIFSYRTGGLEVDVLNEQSAYVAMEAVELFRELNQPLIIVSGGVQRPERYSGTEAEALREVLVESGVPDERILTEARSTTTREQAVNVAPLLKARGIKRFGLVTAPAHLPRALAVFEAESLEPVPIPARFASEELTTRFAPWQPAGMALAVSQRAMYDHMARVFYWVRSWTSF